MKKLAIVVGLVGGLLFAGCGDDAAVTIDDVWARTSASSQEAGAVYMTINGGDQDDRLIGVSVSSDVAAMAQIHETAMSDDGSGMMSMQEVDAIEVPAGEEVMLEPGGYHVMLMQLAEPLQTGEEIDVTLTFENAGTVEVTAEIREE